MEILLKYKLVRYLKVKVDQVFYILVKKF